MDTKKMKERKAELENEAKDLHEKRSKFLDQIKLIDRRQEQIAGACYEILKLIKAEEPEEEAVTEVMKGDLKEPATVKDINR